MLLTNPNYWDCECETSYIHKKTELSVCPICFAREENQPDSMQDEIDEFYYNKEKL